MELTLIKKKTFKLEVYGKFLISMARKPKTHLPHVLDWTEIVIDHETKMPFTEQQEKDILKLMRKNKTDVLTDGSYLGFYTRVGGGEFCSLAHISHPRLTKYREDQGFRILVNER